MKSIWSKLSPLQRIIQCSYTYSFSQECIISRHDRCKRIRFQRRKWSIHFQVHWELQCKLQASIVVIVFKIIYSRKTVNRRLLTLFHWSDV